MEVEADGADDGDDAEDDAGERRPPRPAEALADAGDDARVAALLDEVELLLPHEAERGEHRQEADGVDHEAEPGADGGDEQAGQRGADDA